MGYIKISIVIKDIGESDILGNDSRYVCICQSINFRFMSQNRYLNCYKGHSRLIKMKGDNG